MIAPPLSRVILVLLIYESNLATNLHLMTLISFSIQLHIGKPWCLSELCSYQQNIADSALFCSYQQNRAHMVGPGGGAIAALPQLTQLSVEENLGRSGRCFSLGASHLFDP